nr:MAG TPA: hypothetical protein [Siphoviridae sp. ct7JV2]
MCQKSGFSLLFDTFDRILIADFYFLRFLSKSYMLI